MVVCRKHGVAYGQRIVADTPYGKELASLKPKLARKGPLNRTLRASARGLTKACS